MGWENDYSFNLAETPPCPLCKENSLPTVSGGHAKCCGCDHIWNPDGSELNGIKCWCKACRPHEERPETFDEMGEDTKK